jgi:hypothetical protein
MIFFSVSILMKLAFQIFRLREKLLLCAALLFNIIHFLGKENATTETAWLHHRGSTGSFIVSVKVRGLKKRRFLNFDLEGVS